LNNLRPILFELSPTPEFKLQNEGFKEANGCGSTKPHLLNSTAMV